MKKITLLTSAFFCLLSFTASAQITKGSVLLGGGISGSKNKSENNNSQESTYSSFGISPAIGVAIKENTVVGLRLSYSHSKSEQPSGNIPLEQKQNGYSAGVFYRRYLGLSTKFYLFGEAAAYYYFNKQENTYPGSVSSQESKSAGLNFYPGVAYAVNKRIHLEVGLNNLVDLSYGSSTTKSTSSGNTVTSKSSGLGFTTNVSASAPLTVGFRFVLGK
jgi:hypothetical protein